ncbi:MAG: hypothetical protein CO108_27125 [Deltaproteobacteria bacterium CG_4_9_14_3_um_filter_63_12]|nr:MAG: hypothetical protein CO108_27125 [Deltaproteobacteria bacterium CG_4_9_14_3_um_filter_63_12]
MLLVPTLLFCVSCERPTPSPGSSTEVDDTQQPIPPVKSLPPHQLALTLIDPSLSLPVCVPWAQQQLFCESRITVDGVVEETTRCTLGEGTLERHTAYDDETVVYTFVADEQGRLLEYSSKSDISGENSEVHCVLGYEESSTRLLFESCDDGCTAYGYDQAGRLIADRGKDQSCGATEEKARKNIEAASMMPLDYWPGGAYGFIYNDAGLIVSQQLCDGAGDNCREVSTFSYDELGRLSSALRHGGQRLQYRFNDKDQLVEIIDDFKGTSLHQHFTYDTKGRLVLKSVTHRAQGGNTQRESQVIYEYDCH